MKCAMVTGGNTFVRPMKAVDDAYLSGACGQWCPGYMLADDCTDIHWMIHDAVLCGMYEGYQHCGVIHNVDDDSVELSWCVIPESDDEVAHLEAHCPEGWQAC